jgi:hypothetical protein
MNDVYDLNRFVLAQESEQPPAFIGLLQADYCSGAAEIEIPRTRVLLLSRASGIVSSPSLFAMM